MSTRSTTKGRAMSRDPVPFAVFSITPRADGGSTWSRVGEATPNLDGSLTILLDAPVPAGAIHIRREHPADVRARKGAAHV